MTHSIQTQWLTVHFLPKYIDLKPTCPGSCCQLLMFLPKRKEEAISVKQHSKLCLMVLLLWVDRCLPVR